MSGKELVPFVAETKNKAKGATILNYLIEKLVNTPLENEARFTEIWESFKELMYFGSYFPKLAPENLVLIQETLLKRGLYQESWRLMRIFRSVDNEIEETMNSGNILCELREFDQAAIHFQVTRNILYSEMYASGDAFSEKHKLCRELILYFLVSEAECWLKTAKIDSAKEPLDAFDRNIEILSNSDFELGELSNRYAAARSFLNHFC